MASFCVPGASRRPTTWRVSMSSWRICPAQGYRCCPVMCRVFPFWRSWPAISNSWVFRRLAVGDFGLVLRYNGREWGEFNVGTENFLYDVWGPTLDDIYAVGLSGTLAHFNGQRWQLQPVRLRDDLLSLSGTDAAGVYAVGTQGRVLRLEAGEWVPEPSGIDVGLRAVKATVNGAVYAVGDQGTILRRPAG